MSELEKQKNRYALKKAKNRLIQIVFICIIIIGLVICSLPYLMNHVVMQYSVDKSNEIIHKIDADKINENKKRVEQTVEKAGGKENYGEVSSIDPYITYNPGNIRSVDRVPLGTEINPDYLVGQLVIPSVGLNIAVLEGLTNENLDVASGTMKPGQVLGKGNYAIAGHHMIDEDLLFTPLMNVRDFDTIYITDKARVYEYVVTDTFIVPPTEGQVINDDQGKGIITLVTCSDPEGTNRWIVRGKFMKSYPVNQANQEIKEAIQI